MDRPRDATPTIVDLQERTEAFLTRQMPEALRAIHSATPPFSAGPGSLGISDAARADVSLRHLRGASDCIYRINAFGDVLFVQLQLNVWRFVVVYRIPTDDSIGEDVLQARLSRWQIGACHAGWTVGWREAVDPEEGGRHFAETYCYARTARDFLFDAAEQLYWRTDIVQMTRHFMLEARRCGIRLSPDSPQAPLS